MITLEKINKIINILNKTHGHCFDLFTQNNNKLNNKYTYNFDIHYKQCGYNSWINFHDIESDVTEDKIKYDMFFSCNEYIIKNIIE